MKRDIYFLGGVAIVGLAIAQILRKQGRPEEYSAQKKPDNNIQENQLVQKNPSHNSPSILNLFLGSIAGTSAMTAFSYWKSYKEQEQFEEPVMLGKLLHRMVPNTVAKIPSFVFGWLAHYTIGLLFIVVYGQVWKKSSLKPGVGSGTLLGIPSGLIGMAVWAAMLKLHPNPPHTNLKKHLAQLFTAHVIFGICSAVTYQGLQKINAKTQTVG